MAWIFENQDNITSENYEEMGILDYNQKVALTFAELAGPLATLIPDPLGPVLGPRLPWAVQDQKVTLLFYGPGGKYLCYNHQSLKACIPRNDSTILDISKTNYYARDFVQFVVHDQFKNYSVWPHGQDTILEDLQTFGRFIPNSLPMETINLIWIGTLSNTLYKMKVNEFQLNEIEMQQNQKISKKVQDMLDHFKGQALMFKENLLQNHSDMNSTRNSDISTTADPNFAGIWTNFGQSDNSSNNSNSRNSNPMIPNFQNGQEVGNGNTNVEQVEQESVITTATKRSAPSTSSSTSSKGHFL